MTALRTRFTDLVGCRLPLQLAVLGGVGTTELAAAVIRSGGLGMVPRRVDTPDPRLGPAGVGFLVPFIADVDAVTERVRGSRVAEFFFGEPDVALVAAGHAAGALVSWQVGSVDEARAAQAVGCDLVVAQGVEAGGHVRGSQPLDLLLAEVLAAVRVPVVAAGGIGTAERVAELVAAGADAVRIGTRFLATPECDTHPVYVEALLAADGQNTSSPATSTTTAPGPRRCVCWPHRSKLHGGRTTAAPRLQATTPQTRWRWRATQGCRCSTFAP